MNALQVRDVTNLGYWTGTDPNNPAILDTTSSNFATNLYTAPLATTTLGSAQTPLNGVTFADVYWNGGSSNPIAQNNITVAAGGVSTSNLYFQNNALSYTFSSADAIGISGSTAVTLSGGGMVTFNGPNSYTGPTAIYSGTLVLGNPAAVQNSTVTVGANNGLQFSSGLGTAVLGGLAGAGNFVLNDQASNPMTIVVGANNANTAYSGALSGGGSLSKTGTGTLTLSGASSYGGGTSINQGAIQVTNGSALGTGNIYIGSSGTLTYNTSGGQIVPVATTITGTGTLNVTGTNTLTFGQGGAAYQVNVNLSAGAQINLQSGYLETSSYGYGFWYNNQASLYVAPGATVGLKEHQVVVDALSGSGSISQDYGCWDYPSLVVGVANGSGTFAGVIQDNAGAASLAKTGTGTQVLSGANTYSGGTIVNNGGLTLTGGGAINSGGQLIVTGSGGAAPVFNLAGGNFTSSNGGDAIYVGVNSGDTGTVNIGSGSISLTGNSSAAVLLADDGNGTWNQTGGSVTLAGGFWQANQDGSIAQTSISGGILTCNTFLLTQRGAGTLNISGSGSVTANTVALVGWTEPACTGTVNLLTGGTLTAGAFRRTSPARARRARERSTSTEVCSSPAATTPRSWPA